MGTREWWSVLIWVMAMFNYKCCTSSELAVACSLAAPCQISLYRSCVIPHLSGQEANQWQYSSIPPLWWHSLPHYLLLNKTAWIFYGQRLPPSLSPSISLPEFLDFQEHFIELLTARERGECLAGWPMRWEWKDEGGGEGMNEDKVLGEYIVRSW